MRWSLREEEPAVRPTRSTGSLEAKVTRCISSIMPLETSDIEGIYERRNELLPESAHFRVYVPGRAIGVGFVIVHPRSALLVSGDIIGRAARRA